MGRLVQVGHYKLLKAIICCFPSTGTINVDRHCNHYLFFVFPNPDLEGWEFLSAFCSTSFATAPAASRI